MSKEFKINNLGDYHNLYVQSDTLLFSDVFKNFRNKCIKIYELDPAHFHPYLDWIGVTSVFKKTEIILELPTDVNTLLIV